MNKAKNVAWHKHLAKDKRLKEKQRLANKAAGTTTTTPAPATVRR